MNDWMPARITWLQERFLTAWCFEVLLQSILLLAAAAAIAWLWRRAAAATRHFIWFAGIISLLLLLCLATRPHLWRNPLWSLSRVLNSGNQVALTLTLMPLTHAASSVHLTEVTTSGRPPSTPVNPGNPMAARLVGSWVTLGLCFWAGGTALLLVWLVTGLLRLRQLRTGATVLDTAEWEGLLSSTCHNLGLRRQVTLLKGETNIMPVTWGLLRPVILLPAEAGAWPSQRRRLVLLHELAHIKRFDFLT